MVDAISYVSKEQFEKSPELKAKYGSYEKFQLAQLKSQSIHTFAQNNPKYSYNPSEAFYNMRMEAYEKHQAQSEALIANYLYDQGLYNKTSSSVNEAYSKFIAALQTANYQTHRIV